MVTCNDTYLTCIVVLVESTVPVDSTGTLKCGGDRRHLSPDSHI